MPTPRPTLRPVFEEVAGVPLLSSKGAPLPPEEDVEADEEAVGEADETLVEVRVVDVEEGDVDVDVDVDCGLVVLVGEVEETLLLVGVVAVEPTNSTVVGTDAATRAVVVGV